MKPQICHIPNAEEASKNRLSNNNDTPIIMKYGFLVWRDTEIVVLCTHCTQGAPQGRVAQDELASHNYIPLRPKAERWCTEGAHGLDASAPHPSTHICVVRQYRHQWWQKQNPVYSGRGCLLCMTLLEPESWTQLPATKLERSAQPMFREWEWGANERGWGNPQTIIEILVTREQT